MDRHEASNAGRVPLAVKRFLSVSRNSASHAPATFRAGDQSAIHHCASLGCANPYADRFDISGAAAIRHVKSFGRLASA